MKPRKRQGKYFTCKYCGDEFYRRPSHIRRGITKTCGKRACISASTMGPNNAFWGKSHDAQTREKMKSMRSSKPLKRRKKDGTPFGHPQTKETREKISAGVRRDWAENRDRRLAACAKSGETQRMNNINKEPRYRLQFTPMQRREWTENACRWCDATEDLALDHIIPVMAGGSNHRSNAQTLCRRCNMWKMRYIDKPLVLSLLDSDGAKLQPRVPGNGQSVTFAANAATDRMSGGAPLRVSLSDLNEALYRSSDYRILFRGPFV